MRDITITTICNDVAAILLRHVNTGNSLAFDAIAKGIESRDWWRQPISTHRLAADAVEQVVEQDDDLPPSARLPELDDIGIIHLGWGRTRVSVSAQRFSPWEWEISILAGELDEINGHSRVTEGLFVALDGPLCERTMCLDVNGSPARKGVTGRKVLDYLDSVIDAEDVQASD
jgi:hypothetical protein